MIAVEQSASEIVAVHAAINKEAIEEENAKNMELEIIRDSLGALFRQYFILL